MILQAFNKQKQILIRTMLYHNTIILSSRVIQKPSKYCCLHNFILQLSEIKMSSQSNFNERMDRTNWLSRLSAKFAGNPLRHYVPLRQQLPTELDGYEGKYSKQDDFLYFKNMMKMEAYAERKTPAQ